MPTALTEQAFAAQAQCPSASRLSALRPDTGASPLLVEAFAADDALQGNGARDIILLSTDARFDIATLLGKS